MLGFGSFYREWPPPLLLEVSGYLATMNGALLQAQNAAIVDEISFEMWRFSVDEAKLACQDFARTPPSLF